MIGLVRIWFPRYHPVVRVKQSYPAIVTFPINPGPVDTDMRKYYLHKKKGISESFLHIYSSPHQCEKRHYRWNAEVDRRREFKFTDSGDDICLAHQNHWRINTWKRRRTVFERRWDTNPLVKMPLFMLRNSVDSLSFMSCWVKVLKKCMNSTILVWIHLWKAARFATCKSVSGKHTHVQRIILLVNKGSLKPKFDDTNSKASRIWGCASSKRASLRKPTRNEWTTKLRWDLENVRRKRLQQTAPSYKIIRKDRQCNPLS